ncbi:hypothetical protein H8E77_01395 [bacterium]|nr:hypothetical protein [bacterium]
MQYKKEPRFNPEWRDDIFHPYALEIPLVLPEETSLGDGVWVKKKQKREETVFGKEINHESPRWLTAIVKRSDIAKFSQVKDSQGNILPPDHPMNDFFFPPKAWVSDSAEERCTMFSAAEKARGKVLSGGLGLAIYPQFVLHLKRPVHSITIVECNPKIIRLIEDSWLKSLDKEHNKINIIEGTIEEYLRNSQELFDTIYLDTWEDADPRFLAHVNYLIQLALLRCLPDGQIQCWGYARMVDIFVENAKMFAEHSFPLTEYRLDPALERYSEWLNEQHAPVSPEAIEQVAREFALTTIKSLEEYDRHRCFTSFGLSFGEAYRNMALSRKEVEIE